MKDIIVIYIVGSGHSGSTLVDTLLGGHRKIVSLGECERIGSSANLKLLCSCGELIEHCSFWRQWFESEKDLFELGMRRLKKNKKGFFAKNKTYSVLTYNSRELSGLEIILKYIKFTESLFDYVAKKTCNTVFVDSSKNIHRVELITKNTKIKPIILHLVRDVRGVAASGKRKYDRKVLVSIRRWLIENIKVHILAWKLKEPRYLVRYEDFVLDPMKYLNRISNVAHLELRNSEQLFVTSDRHQPAGNRLRFTEISKISLDRRWEKELSFFEKTLCLFLAGPMSIFYYYEAKFCKK